MERISTLELALENADWQQLTFDAEQEFSRAGLRAITELSRIMYLKNPLIKRGVNVKVNYVWGQGMSVEAADEDINAVIQAWMEDAKNKAEFTGHQAREIKEQELQTDGNLFLVLFTNRATGRVRLRSVPFGEIDTIITNPEDRKEPWFYLRKWNVVSVGPDDTRQTRSGTAYYPDWQHTPVARPPSIGSTPIRWDEPIYHIKVGGFSDWLFGVSEVYSAIDWARAYKEFLEDWASIVRAYRRFAFQLTTPGGKRGIAAAKSKLSTTLGSNSGSDAESNPPPVAGSVFISGPDTNLQPVRTSGATVSAEDGRRLLLMVAASLGLPETFFGDVSVGTLATARSLDRPTELAMGSRQTLWEDIHQDLLRYVLLWAVKAPGGPLRNAGTLRREIDGDWVIETIEWGAETNPLIDIDFPPLVSRDPAQDVDAIVKAATLGGTAQRLMLEERDIVRLLLSALGENDIDEILAAMFDEEGNRVGIEPEDGQMAEAARNLREAIMGLAEKYANGPA